MNKIVSSIPAPCFYPTSTKTRIETFHQKLRNTHTIVFTQLPLKQGLKQNAGTDPMLKNEGFYPTSTKTRIETLKKSKEMNVFFQVFTQLPLKQGLKQSIIYVKQSILETFLPNFH